MNVDSDLPINLATYEWSVQIFSILKKVLHLNLKLHHSKGTVEAGEIFVFNHFTRFETFVPPYLIYQETGAFCRSVAASDFFVKGSPFSNYLLNIGAVPNNHPRLLPFLAEEILRGRKVIIFPEGGMVKDHRVFNSSARSRGCWPTGGTTRKQHTGAAVLALALDAFKTAILQAYEKGDLKRVKAWGEALRLDKKALLAAAHRPTLIVPANITYYPIRVVDNILRKVAEVLSRGLSQRLSEELLIEGNILFKDTDMDIRLGDPVRPADLWSGWERELIAHRASKMNSLDGLFRPTPEGGGWITRLTARRMRRNALRIRDKYTQRIYTSVTVNLGHLASYIILTLADKGQTEIDHATLHRTLYLAVKKVQQVPSVHLHQSLKDPEAYSGLVGGHCPDLDRFLQTAASMNLVETQNGRYRFLLKLCQEHENDEVRLENLIVVYANEAAPIPGVTRSVRQAIEEAPTLDEQTLAAMRFDDELIAYARDRQSFSKPSHKEVNEQETATESGAPFLLLPEKGNELGVVLVHGLLASPAEVRSFGEKLNALGYPVIGVRIKGHGTSPWDLRERSWEDWLDSVRQGFEIMSGFVRRICLVGFSTGGALVLRLAADIPERLVGVAAISVPLKLRDRNMIFAPLVCGVERAVRLVPTLEGTLPFRSMDSEHPQINYRNVPIRCLCELRRLIDELEERLPDIQCPVTLIQGSDDPLVEPISAELIHKSLGTNKKNLAMVPARRHGILYEDIGDTHEIIISFLTALASSEQEDETVCTKNRGLLIGAEQSKEGRISQ